MVSLNNLEIGRYLCAAPGIDARRAAANVGSGLGPGPRLSGVHNHFLGNDPTHWRSHVPLFAAVDYKGMYPGIEVRVRDGDGTLEYDLSLAPGADLEQVQVAVEGGLGLRHAATGPCQQCCG